MPTATATAARWHPHAPDCSMPSMPTTDARESLQLCLKLAAAPGNAAYKVTIELFEIDLVVESVDLHLRGAVRAAADRCAQRLRERGYEVTSADVKSARSKRRSRRRTWLVTRGASSTERPAGAGASQGEPARARASESQRDRLCRARDPLGSFAQAVGLAQERGRQAGVAREEPACELGRDGAQIAPLDERQPGLGEPDPVGV